MGSLHEKSVVSVNKNIAILCLIVNWFCLPGFGTMIATICSEQKPMEGFIVGFIQMVTFEFIVGWVWSVISGW